MDYTPDIKEEQIKENADEDEVAEDKRMLNINVSNVIIKSHNSESSTDSSKDKENKQH